MKNKILTLVLILTTGIAAFAQPAGKIKSTKTHFKFYSHTTLEDIEASNYKAVGALDKSTGDVIFSVPMQSFEFEKAKMQQHYNSPKFLDTKKFPKSKFVGRITDLNDVNFNKNGEYNVQVEGNMTIHGETQNIKEPATITVNDDNIELKTKFNLKLTDYSIAFKNGKPSTNIAKVIEISAVAEY
jgi:polyisoprenoid-binding protein YceI